MSLLQFKIFNREGAYVAATRGAEEAAMLVAALGTDTEIRIGHSKKDRVWREGYEAKPAAESYDFVSATVSERLRQIQQKAYAKVYGQT